MKLLFLLLFTLLINLNATVIDFTQNSEKILLESELYIDREDLNFSQMKESATFFQSDTDHINLGFVKSLKLWIKLEFHNTQNSEVKRVLEIRNPLLESITLYGDEEVLRKGMLYEDKNHKNINRTFELKLKALEHKIYYLEVENFTTALRLGIFLKDKVSFLEADYTKKTIIAIFLSVILLLLAYNLLLFIYTKEKAYAFYCFYLLTLIFQQSTYLGISQIFVPQWFIYYDNMNVVLKVNIMFIAAALFAKSFLQTYLYPNINKVYNAIIVAAIVEIPLFGTPWLYYPEIAILTGFIFVVFNIFASSYIYKQGYKQARFFVIGWSFLVVGFIIMIFDGLGLINIMYKMSNLIIFLTALEAIALSLAFTDRYMILKVAKEDTDTILLETLQERHRVIEQEIQSRTKDLNRVLENKKILLKELHHRTKNNLQLILSMVRMQADHSTQELKEEYRDLEGRINAISKTHEALYMRDDLQRIDMGEYVSELCSDLQSLSMKEIEINISISDVHMPLQEASYIGLIINELMTNSIKYVNKESIIVDIDMSFRDSTYSLIFKDNGDGFDYETLHSSGLGTKLVNTLVEHQLDGKIDTINDNGFKYMIEYKI